MVRDREAEAVGHRPHHRGGVLDPELDPGVRGLDVDDDEAPPPGLYE